jgi:hypothetical protein
MNQSAEFAPIEPDDQSTQYEAPNKADDVLEYGIVAVRPGARVDDDQRDDD